MGDRTTNEMENLSLRTDTKFPRDFLQIFTSGIGRRSDPEEDRRSGEDVELNLGLSLGGRFGVDKSNNNINNKLVRSSSVATILPVVRDDDVLVGGHNNINNPGGSYSGLTRTTSLPVETEEEWRKRKELQSLRRLAAKRRRSEKLNNNNNNNNNNNLAKGEYVAAIKRQGSRGETSSPLQENSKPPSSPAGIGGRKNSIGLSEEMPCVFTQGDGPNGRVVEGILYKYGKGEQVKIMCVCHGSFLSPAEFVKHAGGTDFVHPLKHIVVKPSTSF